MHTAGLGQSRVHHAARAATTRVPVVAGAGAGVIAILALVSWPLDAPLLRGAIAGRFSMVPNTAVALIAAAIALAAARLRLTTPWRAAAIAASLVSIAFGAAAVGAYALGWDTGALDLLFYESGTPRVSGGAIPGRMEANAALCLVALGVATIVLHAMGSRRRQPSMLQNLTLTILASAVFASGFLALIGHLYGVRDLYGLRGLGTMAPNTALALCTLATGVLFARRDAGLGEITSGNDAGAMLARRLLPVALLGPVLIGALSTDVVRDDIMAANAATIVRSLIEVLLFLLVVLLTARRLRLLDEERSRVLAAERAARTQEESERVRIERLQEFTATLGAARTPVEVARATLSAGCGAVGCSRGSVYGIVEDGRTLARIHAIGWDDATQRAWERIPNSPETLAGDAVARRTPIVIGRRSELERRYSAMRPLLEETNYSGGAVFPLMPHGPEARRAPEEGGRRLDAGDDRAVLGFVSFDFDRERDLADADVRYLAAIAQLCAQALERAQLFEAERAARKAAVAEREQLALLVDALPVMVTVYDPSLATTPRGALTLNRAFVETLGWSEDDARAQDLMELCYPDPDVRAIAREHMQHGGASWLEIPTRARNGRLVPVRWGSVRLTGDRQVSVGIDQTAERERTAERAFLFDAERRSRAQAEAARAAAEEANRSKSQFLARMSHELRTPLNAIGGHLQLVEMGLHGPVNDAQREALGRAQKAQHHLLSLINDVLNYAKLEAGRVEFDVRPIPVMEVVREVASIIAPQVQAKQLTLDISVPPLGAEEVQVWADREKLVQTLFNLISNAIKFTPSVQPSGAPGRITVELSVLEDSNALAYLSVHDTGIGIPADRQSAIFDPFVQVRSGLTREHSGTGLGLAISRDLARGMGGDLWVRSEDGVGSTFTLMLRRVTGTPVSEGRGDGRDSTESRGPHDSRTARGTELAALDSSPE